MLELYRTRTIFIFFCSNTYARPWATALGALAAGFATLMPDAVLKGTRTVGPGGYRSPRHVIQRTMNPLS
jgi:hypothetical protein